MTGARAELVGIRRPGLLSRAWRFLLPEGWGSLLQYLAFLLVLALAAISLFPLYFCTITAFKPPADVATVPPSLVIRRVSLENFRQFLEGTGVANAPVGRWFLNSSLVTIVNTFGGLLVSSLAGYSFARKNFPGRRLVFSLIISTILIPGWSTIIASYALTYRMGLHDSYWVLILPAMASPFAVFLVRQFMLTLPTELFQAAIVDGASEWQLYARIAVPLCKPVLAVLALFTIVGTWNDFLWPLLVLNQQSRYTLPVGVSMIMYQIQGRGPSYGIGMAASILMSIVPIIAFLLMQKQMVQGLTIGALKG
ncbi:MAG: carbohydrate ABC transporter permease [Anaerolineae bacterium]